MSLPGATAGRWNFLTLKKFIEINERHGQFLQKYMQMELMKLICVRGRSSKLGCLTGQPILPKQK